MGLSKEEQECQWSTFYKSSSPFSGGCHKNLWFGHTSLFFLSSCIMISIFSLQALPQTAVTRTITSIHWGNSGRSTAIRLSVKVMVPGYSQLVR
jgi:hypothetical protein